MNELLKKTHEAKSKLEQLRVEFLACNQDRSLFQLEKFVIGQNDTPERQYLQVMTELRSCYGEIKRLMLEWKETEIALNEIAALEETPRLELAKERILLQRENVEYQLDAKLKEFVKLSSLKEKIPSFSVEEIEAAESAYFVKRLERQALEDRASDLFKISVGNLRALDQAGIVQIQAEGDKIRLIEGTQPNGKQLEAR